MKGEIAAIENNGTWKLVDFPIGKKLLAIGGYIRSNKNQMVKLNILRHVWWPKVIVRRRLYRNLCSYGQDVTVRIILALVVASSWPIYQLDVNNVFLQGYLNEEVYMELSPGFCRQGEKRVCCLLKSLYNLKQALCQWNLKLTEALAFNAYQRSKYDYYMFTRNQGQEEVVILVYVDDILITNNNDKLIKELTDHLQC